MGVLEFYNKRLRYTCTVAVEEPKTARQDIAVGPFEWLVGLVESDNTTSIKYYRSIYFIFHIPWFIPGLFLVYICLYTVCIISKKTLY